MDASGERLFFTDVGNHVVRAVDFATGEISTVAGGGEGDVGEGRAATEAAFSTHSMRVTVDAGGNCYVTDAHKDSVFRVDAATGIMKTYAGNGIESYSGDGGPATSAGLAVPHCARFDRAGNLFIADTRNHRVRRVDGASGLISTVAGTGQAGYSGDGIPAADAQLDGPLSVVVDKADRVYIVDTGNSRLRRIDADTGLIETVAGTGEIGPLGNGIPAAEATFGRLRDVLLRNGTLIVCDGHNGVVCSIELSTSLLYHLAGSGENGFAGDGGPAVEALLDHPYSIAYDASGNLYIKDSKNGRIRRVEAETGLMTTFAGNGEYGYTGDGGPALSAALGVGK